MESNKFSNKIFLLFIVIILCLVAGTGFAFGKLLSNQNSVDHENSNSNNNVSNPNEDFTIFKSD